MLRCYRPLLLLALCCARLSVAAQTQRIDHIKKQLNAAGTDGERLNDLLGLCEEWESYSPDSFRLYISQAGQLAKAQHHEEAQRQVAYYTGAYYFQKNKLDTATQIIQAEIDGMQRKNLYNALYVKLDALKGNVLFRTDKLDSALAMYYDLMKKAEAVSDTFGLLKARLGIGNVHLKLNKIDECLKWYYQCTSLMQQPAYKRRFSFLYNNMALAFYNLSEEDSCYAYIRKGIQYAREAESLTNLANAYMLYGGISAEFQKLQQAEASFHDGLEVRKKIGDVFYIIGDMATLALFYANLPEPQKGIALCEEGLTLAQKNGRSFPNIRNLYIALGKNYKAAGNYRQYSETQQKLLEFQDSSYRQNTAEKLGEIQTKYDVQKKENTIIQQKLDLVSTSYQLASKKYQLYATLLLLLCGVALGIVFFRNYRKKQQLKLALVQAEEKHLSAQAVMKAEEAERKRIAADLHDSLGAYAASITSNIELVMANNNNGSVRALQELRNNSQSIVSQLADTIWVLQKETLSLTAISDRIKVFIQQISPSFPAITIDVEEEITTDHTLPPSQAFHLFQMMQEAINNALRHSQCSHVVICITGRDGWSINIIDNGRGIQPGATTAGGNGISNMQKRARQSGWTIDWKPAHPTGTQVIIHNLSI